MEELKKKRLLTKEEMQNIVTGGASLSNAATYKRINKMIYSGKLARIKTGQYVFSNKNKFNYSFQSKTAIKVYEVLNKSLNKTSKFIIYETIILNEFLNHLIANSSIIVEVEKDLLEQVFWLLRDNGFINMLLKPSENDNYLYNPYSGQGIIIKPLISKSPINKKDRKTSIEKLIVDIVTDKTLNMFFEGSEKTSILKNILDNYAVRIDSIRNYAKRRHSFDKLLYYFPKEYIDFLYD